jgi:RND family efflux transporter MFP subunit
MAAERRPVDCGPRELVPEIQQEIDRLPEKYRSAVVLCDLEGLSRDEAAGQLRVPSATVRARLARARHRLRGRLLRRGLAPGAIAAAAAEAHAMPTLLVNETIRAAMRIAAGRAAEASGPVATLMKEVLRAMFLTKLKSVAILTAAAATVCLAAVPLFGARAGDGPPPSQTVADKAPEPAKVPGVAVATVAAVDVARTTNLVGSAQPFQSIEIYAKSSGHLKVLAVDIGRSVKRGEMLAEIDAPDRVSAVEIAAARVDQAKAKVQQAKAAVVGAEATAKADLALLEVAKSDVAAAEATADYRRKQTERIEGLVKNHAVESRLGEEAASQLETARGALAAAKAKLTGAAATRDAGAAHVQEAMADLAQAQADVRVAEAELAQAKMLVAQATISSPIDGVVTKRNFHVGDFVRSGDQPGAAPLLTIVRADRVRVVVHLPQDIAANLEGGGDATVRLGKDAYKARISRMGYALEPNTGTLRAEIDVDNPDGRIRPGQSGTVSIDVDPKRRRLVIPAQALLSVEHDGKAECVRVQDGRAALTQIKISPLGGTRVEVVEVVEGLREGDTVLLNPPAGIKDGQAVGTGRP